MSEAAGSNRLQNFFSGVSEWIFQSQLGVADPPLIDYLSHMLVRFLRSDAVYRIRNPKGKRMSNIGEMMVEADERIGPARREVHRHIGDFTLFWAGLFPESLRSRKDQPGDEYLSYCAQGKRAYWIASSIELEDEAKPSADVLARLSCEFELCAYGLREVRREWESSDDGEPGLLLG